MIGILPSDKCNIFVFDSYSKNINSKYKIYIGQSKIFNILNL